MKLVVQYANICTCRNHDFLRHFTTDNVEKTNEHELVTRQLVSNCENYSQTVCEKSGSHENNTLKQKLSFILYETLHQVNGEQGNSRQSLLSCDELQSFLCKLQTKSLV
jgi:hypothetical protein